mmetsp:Transcript_38034/g.88954  ORF Transcript_38034/g.88954 Transcript_38034/m.88954 type:complete len:255 (-) Transcript_38034:6236-7000(-)
MRGQETSWVRPSVLVGLTPLESLWSNPVCSQRNASRGEAGCDDDGLVGKPSLVVCQHLGMEGDVLRTQVWRFMRLGVDPSQWLQVAQVVVVGQLLWQRDGVVGANLWDHHHTSDLLHLGVIRWGDAVQVRGNFRPEVADANEALQDVLWHDVRVACLSDVLTVHIQVVRSQVERRGADGANSPFRARGEGLLLVGRSGGYDHFLAVDVDSLRRDGRDLRHLLALLLNVSNLLPLDGWRGDLHTQDDIADLTLCQ